MKRASTFHVTSVLSLLLLSACASTPDTAKSADAAPAKQTDAAPDPNADVATIAKDLPTTLDGEIKRAQLLRGKGDFEDATRALAQLMLVAPDDPRVVGEYGKVLAQTGHSQDALPFLQRAAAMEPKDWTIYSALGVVYDQLDDRTHAKLAYEHALTVAPGQPTVLNNFAVSRMLAGDLSGARQMLAEASAHQSDNPKIASNLDMLASMQSQAPAKPETALSSTLPHPPANNASGRPASAAPKSLTPQVLAQSSAKPAPVVRSSGVVMEAVPADPQAGPVKTKTPAHVKLASATKPKPVAPAAPPPALRTAAEAN